MQINMSETPYHIPAMLKECIEALDIKPGGVYADATFGGGGHSRAILSMLGEEGHLYGFDRDMDAMANVPDDSRFTFVHSNFRHMRNFMRFHGIDRFDGIIADLGVSFHHFDDASRGFSFRSDAPLDMRMNRKASMTAADIVADSDKEELTKIFRLYTDLKRPGAVADAILNYRKEKAIATTAQLSEAVASVLNPRQEKKDLSQVFQALRIAVNAETDALSNFLLSTPSLLKEGGRLVILTYHSIEDRMVKNFLRSGNLEGVVEKDFYGRPQTPWKLVGKNPMTPTAQEVEENPRARSAKLRVAELIETK